MPEIHLEDQHGERNRLAKLTNAIVLQLRLDYPKSLKAQQKFRAKMAKRYNCHPETIRKACLGRTYSQKSWFVRNGELFLVAAE